MRPKGVLCRRSQVKVRSHWIRLGPQPSDWCSYQVVRHLETQREEGHLKMEQRLEWWVHKPGNATPEARREHEIDSRLRGPGRDQFCRYLDFGLLAPRTLLSPPATGDCHSSSQGLPSGNQPLPITLMSSLMFLVSSDAFWKLSCSVFTVDPWTTRA